MALFGNVNMGSYNKRAGDIFVVYDWENTKIHDCVFLKVIMGGVISGLSKWVIL